MNPNASRPFGERVLVNSRILLVPLYFGLIAGLLLYNIAFFIELWKMWNGFFHTEELRDFVLLGVLGIVDMTMIANLIYMVISGSYSIFVKEIDSSKPGLPRILKNLTSGMLKVKMGGSLVMVTSVHLLADFMNHHVGWEDILKRAFIHVLFIISAYVFAKMEDMAHPAALQEKH